ILTCASLLPLGRSFAQNVILSCGFDNYAGTLATVPAGVTITWNSTSNTTPGQSASFYTSAGNFGLTAPSYKFGVDSATMVTPYVSNADSITFWAKGNSISGPSTLYVSYSADSINWTPITSLNNLPTTSTTLSIPLQQVSGYIKFFYDKDVGNLGMDDLKIYSSTVGLNESLSKDEISVYPSPTTGPLNIRLTEKSGVTPMLEVYDIVGNKVFSGVAERRGKGLYTIDLSGRNKGYYFLKIRNGNQITTRRISLIN
ncbi:MAG: T9SS type A sorting domain-containing protein, partial [Bacteroidota bacterium]